MSTAFFPQGMRGAMPASGYNHHSTYFNQQYLPWKGSGIFSNPVGIAAGHIRPLTNKDPGNVFPTGFGLARPIKHYRKGRVITSEPIVANNLVGNDPYNQNIKLTINEAALINYNMNRLVASSKGTSLGGGFGGSGLLNELQDKPGAYTVKANQLNEISETSQLNTDCKTCQGVGLTVNYYPNNAYLTDNPEPNTQNPVLCCNQEYKAKRRAIYASTNLNKNYYTSHTQYLQNRCKTYEQKAFNFLSYKSLDNSYNIYQPNSTVKPGSPLSLSNTYLANCQPNAEIFDATENAMIGQMLSIMLNQGILTQDQINAFNQLNIDTIQGFFNWINGSGFSNQEERTLAITIFTNYINNPYWGMPLSGPSNPTGCQLVVYKPNNYQFAKQGAVDSSTRNLKLNVDTISTNAASIQNYNNTGPQLITANEIYAGNANNIANLLKNKVPGCNTPTIYPHQNKKLCHYKQLAQYQNPASQPSPYRYFPRAVTSSNHFSQSPNTYNTTGH
jgi:hypothetical protein